MATIASFYKKILYVYEHLVVYRHTNTHTSTTAIVEGLAPQVLSWKLDLKIFVTSCIIVSWPACQSKRKAVTLNFWKLFAQPQDIMSLMT
jgi:hypothetical protein